MGYWQFKEWEVWLQFSQSLKWRGPLTKDRWVRGVSLIRCSSAVGALLVLASAAVALQRRELFFLDTVPIPVATPLNEGGNSANTPLPPFSDKPPPVLVSSSGVLERTKHRGNPWQTEASFHSTQSPSVSCHCHLFTPPPSPSSPQPSQRCKHKPGQVAVGWGGVGWGRGVLQSLGAKEERKCVLCATRWPQSSRCHLF